MGELKKHLNNFDDNDIIAVFNEQNPWTITPIQNIYEIAHVQTDDDNKMKLYCSEDLDNKEINEELDSKIQEGKVTKVVVFNSYINPALK